MYDKKGLQRLLHAAFYGRRLLQIESGCTPEQIKAGIASGMIREIPGITRKGNRLFCNGCGNDHPMLFGWHSCFCCKEQKCMYCRNCITLRKISACTSLYVWNQEDFVPPQLPQKGELLMWQGRLTPAQSNASQKVIRQIEKNEDILIHAVTGSGKTEMLFYPMAYALSQKKKVCFSSPRTDVILEILPRLISVFPQLPIGVFYGGSKVRDFAAPLILSTTHQLMRFHQMFDVCILDESDAFPYRIDSTLKFSLQNALKMQHTLIYCTATPEPTLLKTLKKINVPIVFVAKRFHGRPLEVPHFFWVGNWKRKLDQGVLPYPLIVRLKKSLEQNRQVFLFVAYVEIAKQVQRILAHKKFRVLYVYAEDSRRKEKVEAFRKKEVDIIVTTTILERGVTVPFSDVMVLGSEVDLFDASALIQISGRAGRHEKDTEASVYFFHKGITSAMRQAKKQIIRMNRLAKE